MKIKELMCEWLENKIYAQVKPKTLACYKAIIYNHIMPALGNFEVDQISAHQFYAYITDKQNHGNLINGGKLSINSISGIISILKNAYGYAESLGYIHANIIKNIKYPRLHEKKVEAFTLSEQKIIEEAVMKSNKSSLMGIIICLYTGMRIGELLGLTWDDVDFKKRSICISKTVCQIKDERGQWINYIDLPKTKSSAREIPISNNIAIILKKMFSHRTCEYVIETNGHMTSVRTYQARYSSLIKKCGVRPLSFHSLRHTFATRALEIGIDIKTISEILGHKSAVVTLNRYVHSSFENKRKAIEKMTRTT